jgi:hypothetical protein
MDRIVYPTCAAEQPSLKDFFFILILNLKGEIPFAYRAAKYIHE